jgi:YidC/Oxa1 family membrane protein insertase
MDRRTVLAFVLIFLILVGYPYLMRLVQGPPPEIAATGADTTAVAVRDPVDVPDAGTAGPPPEPAAPAGGETFTEIPTGDPGGPTTAAEALAFAPAGPAETVRVRTPLYHLAIDTRGGRITDWTGLAFGHWSDGNVHLVPPTIPDRGSERVIFRAADLDLGAAPYRADERLLELEAGSGPATLTLTAETAGGLEIRKIYTFHPELYGFEVDLVVAAPTEAARGVLGLTGTPESFRFGWNQGILPSERIERMEEPSMRSLARIGEDIHKKKRTDLKKSSDKVTGQWTGSVHYAGLQTRYFTVLGIVPQEQGAPVEGTIRLSGDEELLAQSWAIDVPAGRGVGEEIALARLDYFIGPQDAALLQAYGRDLEQSMDLGWRWIRPLSEVVLWSLEFMYGFLPNYGVIIIIFSVLTKLLFYPLTKTSTESMKKMQELQPKLKALQDKYKNDKEKLNQATMELYRTEKVNPLSGCLPLLVQSPVFIALYQALSHTISLRGQPFVLWMDDLSAPDALFVMPFSLPFLGSDFNVLPILMAVAMYFQTKLTPTTGGGQMAMMNTMMPVIMIFIFYNMPSGLVLYWLVNTILQAYQTWKIHKAAPTPTGAEAK